jgi:two-component system CheB/CheR fusion protein
MGRHPYLRDPMAAVPQDEATDEAALAQIYRMLQQETAVDFRLYRQTTIRRRIARRMLVHRIDTLDQYRGHLEGHRPELQALYNEVLINVTRFFRDLEAFESLRQALQARLGRDRGPEPSLRVWVPGCATGEEAYSLAMVLIEALETAGARIPLQVFGTDVSEAAVARARAGVYPPNIELDVSPERLRRFFMKQNGQYQVKKSIRELCIFARHSLVKDPPFSGVDIISCRNVLIYIDSPMQRRIMATFHYALRNTGILMLGASETIGPLSELFTVVDKTHKLYAKRPTTTPFTLGLTTVGSGRDSRARGGAATARSKEGLPPVDFQREVDRILLTRYAPAAVFINQAYEILQFRGRTSAYLEPAPGHASLNVVKMAREGLLMGLRAAIQTAQRHNTSVRREGLRVKQDRGFLTVNIEVIPVRGPDEERNYLVLFENAPAGKRAKATAPARPARRGRTDRGIERLEEELGATKEFLQSIIEDREAANEELHSANEELLSSNEELQSTNEELETAKEELQSVNEELSTVNEELQHRNAELGQANNDTNNLVASVNIPIVIVDNNLRIRRFTPMAARAFNLLPADLGRPIASIRAAVDVPDLEALCARVIETVTPIAREVMDGEGGWHSLRIRPYRTHENTIDGAVVVLIDITAVKESLEQVAAARDYAEAIVDTVRTPLLTLDEDFRVRSANRTFYDTFRVSPEETVNRVLFDLGNGQWEIPALRRALGALAETGAPFEDFEVEHEFPSIGPRTMLANGRRIRRGAESHRTILLAIEDITDRREAERDLRASEEIRYRRLFETARDGILLADADTGQITNANPFWLTLTGRDAAAVQGHRLWEIGVFEDTDLIESLFRELQTSDFVRFEDVRLVGREGTRRHAELACNVYLLGGKKIIQCIVRDITDGIELLQRERTARAEAEGANRAKDEFLSVLSHELRTPLTAMLGWARVLRRGALDASKTMDALDTIERNTRLLAQLIEDLLDVSRIAAGKLALDVRHVDLGAVVGAAAETVRESVEAKRLHLEMHLPARSPIVRGDRHRLQQVVWNLLSNAIKFTPDEGRIDVTLEALPACARLTVSDTGRGLSPRLLPQIFERFRQGESVSIRTQGGLGLGLTIVRHLVELHGGTVSVFSAGEGTGTTFTVDLPHGSAAASTTKREDEGTSEAGDAPSDDVRLDGLRVLLVEDQNDTGRMLAQVLGERGATVIYVATAAAALEAMDQATPHVIVSDIGLPGEDGYEFLRHVRAMPTGARVPAIALTAFAREEDIQRATRAGFDVHLAKPVEPAELARIVAQSARSGR